jgi:hypothetical protein
MSTPKMPPPPPPPPPVASNVQDPAAVTAADRVRRRAKARMGRESTILGGMMRPAASTQAKTLLGT